MVLLKDIEIIISHSDIMDGLLQLEQMYIDRLNNKENHDEYKAALKRMKNAIEILKM